MKVYVVEEGVYAERWITGVYYSTLEAAQAAHPISATPSHAQTYDGKGWRELREGEWSNGLDFGEAVLITEFTVNAPNP